MLSKRILTSQCFYVECSVKNNRHRAGSPHPPLTRSPFPYEGKALTSLLLGMTCNVERNTSHSTYHCTLAHNAPRRGAGLMFTSSTAERSPFPSRGRTIARSKLRRDCKCRARHFPYRGERSVAARPGGAKPFAGWGGLEGFTPPHRFKARTASSDGHYASTRACASAPGLILR